VSKNLARTLGGAAAMMSIAGVAPSQVAPARRDTVVAQKFVVMQGQVDSIMILVARIAREPYGSAAWIKETAALDSLVESHVRSRFAMRPPAPSVMLRAFAPAKGWIGVNTQGPSSPSIDSTGTRRIHFFGYQDIISVDPGSPAERAGIKPGDVLVAYNGTDLFNHEFNLSDIIVPKKRVDVSVRRDGEVKVYPLIAAVAPEEVSRRRMDMDRVFLRFEVPGSGTIVVSGDSGPPIPLRATRLPEGRPALAAGGLGGLKMPPEKMFYLSPNGLFGASLSTVSEELSRILKVQKGILVNSVPEETPAFRAGLRTGDVIVTANDDSVMTVGELRELIARRLADHSMTLQVIRKQRPKTLTLSWDSP
jgi:membrane-associated protease RseP (regulator of RpoE activity)